jgi:predicted DNA-binding transcriptional regulator AlpA
MPSATAPLPLDLDLLPADALIDADTVANLIGSCSRHVHRMSAAGKLPPAIHIGKLVRWRAGTLRTWLRRMEAGEAGHAS